MSFSQVLAGGVPGYRVTFSTVLQIIDPWVYFGGLHTGPLYEEGWRTPLGSILGWYCSSVLLLPTHNNT